VTLVNVRRALLAALFVPALASVATAQALPDPKVLMEKHNTAAGGRAALDRHTSIKMTATIAAGPMTATVTMYRAKPNKYLRNTNIAGMGEILEGYDGKTGWTVNPGGPQVVTGPGLEDLKRDADFYSSFEDPTRYTKTETIELAEFNGAKCYKVRLTRDGRDATIYYNAETGLRAGLVVPNQTPQGIVESTVFFLEYADFGGVKMPKKLENRAAGQSAVITFTAVEYDKVENSVFDPPAAVKALIKP
jgi:zinc protease